MSRSKLPFSTQGAECGRWNLRRTDPESFDYIEYERTNYIRLFESRFSLAHFLSRDSFSEKKNRLTGLARIVRCLPLIVCCFDGQVLPYIS